MLLLYRDVGASRALRSETVPTRSDRRRDVTMKRTPGHRRERTRVHIVAHARDEFPPWSARPSLRGCRHTYRNSGVELIFGIDENFPAAFAPGGWEAAALAGVTFERMK